MFTGLVKAVGEIVSSVPFGQGKRLNVDISGLGYIPEIGASIAVCGTCLTVTGISGNVASFDAVAETINNSSLSGLGSGDKVNLEPALCAGDPLDGHIVQGHVDCVGKVLSVTKVGMSNIWKFSLPRKISHLVALKGSVAVDGISLTVTEVGADYFCVSVIPHTEKQTCLEYRKTGDSVNLEADVLARYAARAREVEGHGLTIDKLREAGF